MATAVTPNGPPPLAARVWTITATAERHGLEPLTYLTDYLTDCFTACLTDCLTACLTACLTDCAQSGGKPLEGQDLNRHPPWLPGPTGSQDHGPPKINSSG